jgi:acetolactate synthase-1/2/3 large subunit
MKIRGGIILARALQQKAVKQVFTLSGGFCNPALEGFMECGISVINAPHEQVTGHLADGHTRITRNPAVCLVETRAQLLPAVERAIASGKTACVNVKIVGHISPIVLAMTSKRDKASIE